MLSEIKTINNGVTKLLTDIDNLNKKKESLISGIKTLNTEYTKGKINTSEYKKKLKQVVKGKPEQKQVEEINKSIKNYLEEIEKQTKEIPSLFKTKASIFLETPTIASTEREEIKEFVKGLGKKDKTIKIKKFSTYKQSQFGKISNKLFQEYTKKITTKYPAFFNQLNINLKTANIQIFSSTYLSIALFSAIIATLLTLILLIIIVWPESILGFLGIFAVTALTPIATIFAFYYYPQTLISSRSRAIKNELPFALTHMSAVAGSGARLIDIFAMLLESEEYKALSGEVKRIINYANLLGYNLTTALKIVAKDTPSEEFRETLNGMVSTIETGGDIKQYLKEKANDSLNQYKLRRKKYVSTVSTYSEIYTAILIVAPLLFIVILSIIAGIGEGQIAGISINLIQKMGIFVVLPLVNIGFMVFINIVQPEM